MRIYGIPWLFNAANQATPSDRPPGRQPGATVWLAAKPTRVNGQGEVG
jgi:hypothetical protein